MRLQSVTMNFSGLTRRETMEGRDYIVAPMVMLTEGVHNGSAGPLYYPADELQKMPGIWNHKPVVVYHPEINGVGVSACSPEILSARKVGVIMNTQYETGTGRLKAEAWLEPDRIKKVDNRISDAIEKNEMMELSTGLFLEDEKADGEWNGEKYDAIARNYAPDHLALLPDKIGACSIADGAGFLRNEKGKKKTAANGYGEMFKEYVAHRMARALSETNAAFNELSHSNIRSQLAMLLRERFGPSGVFVEDVFDGFVVYEVFDDGPGPVRLFRIGYTVVDDVVQLADADPEEVVRVTEYRTVGGTVIGNAETKRENGIDFPAGAFAYVPDREKPGGWKLRLWEDLSKKETAAQIGRAVAALGKGFRGNRVQLPAAARPGVIAKVRAAWLRANPGKGRNDLPPVLRNEEVPMEKEKVVNGLIENGKWSEDDREFLMGLEERRLEILSGEGETTAKEGEGEGKPGETTAKEGEGEGKPAENAEEYIAKAPAGIRDMLQSGLDAHNAEKAKLVAGITANSQNVFSKEELEAKGVKELRQIAKLAAKPDESRSPDYSGMGETGPVGNEGEEPLPLPVYNFGKETAAAK